MYLVKTTNGDKILNSADAVKSIKKEDIEKIYFLTEVNYDSVISNAMSLMLSMRNFLMDSALMPRQFWRNVRLNCVN